MPDRNGHRSSAHARGFAARHAAARADARGAIGGISSCARAGLLPPDAASRLNLIYRCRIELALDAASTMWETAQAARELIVAIDAIRCHGGTAATSGDPVGIRHQ